MEYLCSPAESGIAVARLGRLSLHCCAGADPIGEPHRWSLGWASVIVSSCLGVVCHQARPCAPGQGARSSCHGFV